ncbi:MAG TPA: hypothetical protein VLA24_17345 [Pseudomonadales bacterium]|nr:hypothetical protein [Pseudomonadales bacterium]
MRLVFLALTLLLFTAGTNAQPVDQVISTLERQYNAKVISVQERRGGLRVRLLQHDGVVKTLDYRPEGWRAPNRPRIGETHHEHRGDRVPRDRRE